MKRFLVAFLVCTAMLLAQTQAQAASKITVIVASSVDTSEQNYMNVTYKKLVELDQKYSDNAFDFQLFPSMQLGDEQETVRALQLGTLQMSMLATNNYAPFAPSCGWVNMPYLFDTLDEFRALLDAMWEQNNEWAVKEGGCRILSILDIGYRQLTTSAKHPGPQARRRQKGHQRSARRRTLCAWCHVQGLGLRPPPFLLRTFNALQQGVSGRSALLQQRGDPKVLRQRRRRDPDQPPVHSANIIAGERWLQSLGPGMATPDPRRQGSGGIRAPKVAVCRGRRQADGGTRHGTARRGRRPPRMDPPYVPRI